MSHFKIMQKGAVAFRQNQTKNGRSIVFYYSVSAVALSKFK